MKHYPVRISQRARPRAPALGELGQPLDRVKEMVRPTLRREFLLVELPRLVPDGRDFHTIICATIHHAVRSHDNLADVLAPNLGDDATGIRERRQRLGAIEQPLKPLERSGRIVIRYVGDRGVDLLVCQRRPRSL